MSVKQSPIFSVNNQCQQKCCRKKKKCGCDSCCNRGCSNWCNRCCDCNSNCNNCVVNPSRPIPQQIQTIIPFSTGIDNLIFSVTNIYGSMGFGQGRTSAFINTVADAFNFIVPRSGTITQLSASARTTIGSSTSATFTIYRSTPISSVIAQPNFPIMNQSVVGLTYNQFSAVSTPLQIIFVATDATFFGCNNVSIPVNAGDRLSIIVNVSNPSSNPIITGSTTLSLCI